MSQQVLVRAVDGVAYDLVKSGVGLLDFPVEDLVPKVIEGWLEFLKLPLYEKKQWTFLDVENPDDPGGAYDGPDDGYVPREGEVRTDGLKYDIKEFFHYKETLPGFLKLRGIDTSAQTQWLKDIATLHAECVKQYLNVTAALESYFPELNLLERAQRAAFELKTPTLRLLSYKQANVPGEPIAKMHNDRNWLTLHLQDSNPGLVYPMNGSTVEYVKQPGKVLVFPSKKARKITDGRLPSLPHGVVAHPETIGLKRWTVVFFGHIDIGLTKAERDAF